MVWPAIIAGAAALGGSIIDSVTGHDDAKASRGLARSQFAQQMDETIQRRVADSEKAGINPLFALGANTVSPTVHYSGSSSGGGSIGNGIATAGSIFARALQDKQADDMEFDTQAKELDLESARLRNQYLRNQIAQQTAVPGVDVEPPPSREGEQALFSPVYDMQGRPRLVINQNALEADSDNPGYMSSIIATMADGMRKGQISPFTGQILSPQLRMLIDDQYYNMTGHHIKNLEELYISPTEAAMASTMLWRGVS